VWEEDGTHKNMFPYQIFFTHKNLFPHQIYFTFKLVYRSGLSIIQWSRGII
jgi:hypothetical protein